MPRKLGEVSGVTQPKPPEKPTYLVENRYGKALCAGESSLLEVLAGYVGESVRVTLIGA